MMDFEELNELQMQIENLEEKLENENFRRCKVFKPIKDSEKNKNIRYLIQDINTAEYFAVKISKSYDFGDLVLFPKSMEKDNDCWRSNENGKLDVYIKQCLRFDKPKVLGHLSDYKKNTLGISEDGIYCGKGGEKSYPHILPENERWKNLIESSFSKSLLCNTVNLGKNLNKKFHHLNSSQAMAINLFSPVIEEKLFSEFVGFDVEKVKKSEFEYIEDEKEGTQFDFFFKSDKGKHFFEVKYSESNFGPCKNDKKHQAKYNGTDGYEEVNYKAKLEKIGVKIEMAEFFKKYQLYRNLCYAPDGDVFFIFPKFREIDLAKEVEEAKGKMKDDYKKRVHIIFIDDFVEKMIDKKDGDLKAHYSEFKNKYLPQIDE